MKATLRKVQGDWWELSWGDGFTARYPTYEQALDLLRDLRPTTTGETE